MVTADSSVTRVVQKNAHNDSYCWTRLYLSVCDVCTYGCVWCVCVQIPVWPYVQCTYVGPTVHNHNLFLCFKSIYFLIRPPTPAPSHLSAKAGLIRLTHPPQLLSDCCGGALSHPSGCCFGEDDEGLFSDDASDLSRQQESTDIPRSSVAPETFFDEVTWGLLKYRLVNRQDLLTPISTSALKCTLWSLMISISV